MCVGYVCGCTGIGGLLEEGRTYMLAEEGTPHAQQRMVINTLGFLMTPLLPPFYRLFMSGLVPSIEVCVVCVRLCACLGTIGWLQRLPLIRVYLLFTCSPPCILEW